MASDGRELLREMGTLISWSALIGRGGKIEVIVGFFLVVISYGALT